MDWRDEVRRRLEQPGSPPDDDVVEELAGHAASAYDDERSAGRSADEALATARELLDGWCRETPVRKRRYVPTTPAAPSMHTSRRAGLWLEVTAIEILGKKPV